MCISMPRLSIKLMRRLYLWVLNGTDKAAGLGSVPQHWFNKSAVWSLSVLTDWGSVALEGSMWGQIKVIDIIEPSGAVEGPSNLHLRHFMRHWRFYRFSLPLLNAIRSIRLGRWVWGVRVNVPFNPAQDLWHRARLRPRQWWFRLFEWESWYSDSSAI